MSDDEWRAAVDAAYEEPSGSRRPERAGVRRANYVHMDEVNAEAVRWLWEGRIPLGKLTVIDGDPGGGKSTLTIAIAATVTTGGKWPDGGPASAVGSVVMLSAEDGAADTIRPRLDAAAADVRRVVLLQSMACADGETRPFEIPGDLAVLHELVAAERAVLVTVDPLMAFLAGGVNSYRDQDVRRALHPLAEMAEQTGAAVVVVRHLNKSGDLQAMYRGGGSIGITGAARAVHLVGLDPDDAERRIFVPTKSNLARMPAALAYRLVDDTALGVARVEWDGTTDHRADDLLVGPAKGETHTEEAEAFLRHVLAAGPMETNVAIAAVMEMADVSKMTVRRAKKKAGILSFQPSSEELEKLGVERTGKKGSPGWWWRLPEAVTPSWAG